MKKICLIFLLLLLPALCFSQEPPPDPLPDVPLGDWDKYRVVFRDGDNNIIGYREYSRPFYIGRIGGQGYFISERGRVNINWGAETAEVALVHIYGSVSYEAMYGAPLVFPISVSGEKNYPNVSEAETLKQRLDSLEERKVEMYRWIDYYDGEEMRWKDMYLGYPY